MTATLGDFLDRAADGLTEAASVRDLPSSTVIAASARLHRVVTALSRYVADPRMFPEPAAATETSVRLYHAATSLRRAAGAGAGLDGPGEALPLPSRIGGAADGLMAGLDLLATHHAAGRDGVAMPLSPWAPALASPPARAVLLAEVADLAALAGAACRALALVPSPALPQASRNLLIAASGQLTAVRYMPAQSPGWSLAAFRQLVRAAPPAIAPDRHPVAAPEATTDLSAAIGRSAERIRSLTWRSRTGRSPAALAWPPPRGLAAWRWSAHAAAITSHICEQILTGLADRAAQLMPGGTAQALSHAAAAAAAAWNASRHAASICGTLTDAVTWNTPSPIRDDMTDLIIRLGRIAHDDPGWTPASTRRAPLRAPGGLAASSAEFKTVLSAVHEAADALTYITSGDLAAVRSAIVAGSVREEMILVGGQAFRPGSLSDLPRAFEVTDRAAHRAAETIDQLATAARAPSSHLPVMRAAIATRQAAASPQAEDPGQPRARLLAAGQEAKRHQAAALARVSFPKHVMEAASPSDLSSMPRARRVPAHGQRMGS